MILTFKISLFTGFCASVIIVPMLEEFIKQLVAEAVRSSASEFLLDRLRHLRVRLTEGRRMQSREKQWRILHESNRTRLIHKYGRRKR